MTPALTDSITRDRFKRWAKLLKDHTATPVLLVAVGHGRSEGAVHVVQLEDMSPNDMLTFLRFALDTIEGRSTGGEGGAS